MRIIGIGMGLAAFMLAGWATGASAQTMSYAQAGALIAKNCGPSIEKFCARDNIGGGQVSQCLQQHQAEVPQQCFTDFAQVVASIDKRAAAQANAYRICEADIREFCGGVQPGDANILGCLLASTKVVKGACKQVLIDAGWQ